MLRKLLTPRRAAAASAPAMPEGVRVYAVGDIHGRDDLLGALLAEIDADDAARPAARTMLIFVGDLVDRGPASAAVVERLRRLAESRADVRFLMGNHEEVFLAALDGDARALKLFCRIGGRETVLSYGVDASDYEALDYPALADRLAAVVPPEHRAFLAGFEDLIEIGDYAFVHAGVRPGVALDRQRTSDLRWIREPFLDHRAPLDRVVVHGHTIGGEIEFLRHRIGIDTGAYATGKLSAIGLEGVAKWSLSTGCD